MSKISIALCTYNGARFLQEQLESLAGQTRLPDEIVICDDCSTDETLDIIKQFQSTVSFPVRLFVNEQNLGSTKNFEKAVSLCSGEITFLCDQDDVWMPVKINRLTKELEKSDKIGFVFCDAELVDENLQPLNVKLSDLTYTTEIRAKSEKIPLQQRLLQRNYVTGATLAFKTKYKAKFLPIPTHIPEMIHDAWIVFVIAANAGFAFVDEPLIKYRQHSEQQLGILKNKNGVESRSVKYQGLIEGCRLEKIRINQILEQIALRPSLIADSAEIKKLAQETLADLEELIKHYEARKNLSVWQAKRFVPIAKEAVSGRYHKFSRGFSSALKDLLERFN